MNKLKRVIGVLLVMLLITISHVYAQNSNIGTEFWTGYMDHINGVGITNGSKMNLYFAGDVATTVTVSSAGADFTPITASVSPNAITTVSIPTTAFLGNNNGKALKGIHIVSANPVAVYAHIYASSVSGATLLLPVNTMANDYYSINYTQLSNNNPAYSAFMVVATADSTTIQITPSQALIDGSVANKPFLITLQKGELYQGLSNTDLTGTHIMSVSTGTQGCKKIAVFSGSSKIKIGTPASSSDNLFQQAYPTAAWGKNYITVPCKDRNYDVYRVVVSDPITIVKVNGTPINATLTNNFYYEFPSQAANYITADKPIQVVQYAVTQGNTIAGVGTQAGDVGDPEMIYLNPLEQNIDHVTLYSAHEYLITKSFVNVVIPTIATSTFLLDGAKPTTAFTTVPGNTAYSYGQFSVSNASHTISASQGFNAIAYGFGQTESYGYAAGTNVKNLNEFIQVINTNNNAISTTGCTNLAYDPQVALPYKPLSLTWDLGNNTKPVTQNSPSFSKTIRQNDTTLYVYNYGTAINYSVGTYALKVTAVDPISNVCGSTEEIDLNYTVVDPPIGKFASRDTVCRLDTVGFTDQTPAAIAIKSWHWDFGSGVSGDTSNVQNPVHVFQQSGLQTVTLTVTGISGCNTTTTKQVYVRPLPVANFTVPAPICETPLSVSFIDNSTPSEGKIVFWFWDFGDGTTSLRSDNKMFTHQFASAQTYKVTLTVTTDKGCFSSIPQSKYVNFSPKVDFTLPDVCQSDTYAHFTSTTTIADSTTNSLTYSWDFGDGDKSTPGNPNAATGKIAQHHYQLVGVYNVKLTVTTAAGCVKDTIKQLTVNGSNPHAAFTILTKNACSNQLVSFQTNANVPGFNQGKITSFKMDFGDGSAIQTFRLDSGQVFTHKYPNEYIRPLTKYRVSMTAYSGASCSNVATDTVKTLPVPKTTFTTPDSVCQNGSPFKLATYVSQPPGAPVGAPSFYIDGLKSNDGVFNPTVLGAGIHTVTCYYIVTATGCADTTIKKIKVEPIAAVDAGEDDYILSGGQVSLKPKVIGGNNLTYQWLPAAGLSNANTLSPKASPLVTTTYKLTVTATTDGLSCPVSDSVKITVLQPLTIPNTFTPNGDSKNDTWVIKELEPYPGCEVSVYNRNGERVFYSLGYGTPWDGRYNSVNLPVGVYYYIIDPKNGRSKITGYVTIIR